MTDTKASKSYHRVMATNPDHRAASRAASRVLRLETRKAERKARVGRHNDVKPTRDDMSAAHRVEMRQRRARQLERQNGFEPIRNTRVSDAFNVAMLAFVQSGLSPVEAHNAAWRQVARSLPAPRRVRSGIIKPSKSDDAAYRNRTYTNDGP